MKVLELFAGGGGAALGYHRAGHEHLAIVEWDPDACETLRAAIAAGFFTGEVIEGDVTKIDFTRFRGRVDILGASPPCQAWSSAGKRLGAQDDRNLWPATFDVVDQVQPTWLICENVGGLLHHLSAGHPERPHPVTQVGLFGSPEPVMVRDDTPNPDGCARCYWDHVILPEARRRFAHVDWRVIDCADLGVPQHRERLILVCGPEPYRWPVPTHRDPKLVHAVGKPWVTVRQALGIGLETMVVIEEDMGTDSGAVSVDDPAPTMGVKANTYLHAGDPGVRRAGDTLAGSEPWRLDMPSPCVTAVGECKGSGEGGSPHKMQRASDALYLGTGRRRLTPAECAALQSFPSDWPWRGTKTAIYRQIGNACPPPLVEAVVRAISVNCASGARRAA